MKISHIIAFIFLLSSCGRLKWKDHHSDSAAYRNISSKLSPLRSCLQQVGSYVKKGRQTTDSYVKQIKNRRELEKKFKNFSNTVEELNPKAHLPFRGKVKTISDEEESYLARLMMIRNAKKTIDISYYIVSGSDVSTKGIIDELRKAVQRGVKIRFLVDSIGGLSNEPFFKELKALAQLKGPHVKNDAGKVVKVANEDGKEVVLRHEPEVVIFNPIINIKMFVQNWYRRSINIFLKEEDKLKVVDLSFIRRSHDKILMIDAMSKENSMAMIGSRNLADSYYGLGEKRVSFLEKNFKDVHDFLNDFFGVAPNNKQRVSRDAGIIVKNLVHENHEGVLENPLNTYYNKIFYYAANKNINSFLFRFGPKGLRSTLRNVKRTSQHRPDNAYDPLNLTAKLKKMEDDGYLDEGFDEGLVSFTNELQNLSRNGSFFKPNHAAYKANGNSILGKFKDQISKADKTIDIVSPYLWLTSKEIDELIEWVSKDSSRKIRLVTNSLLTNDNLLSQGIIKATIGKKIGQGLKNSPYRDQIELYSYGKLDDELFGGKKLYGNIHSKIFITDRTNINVITSNFDFLSRFRNSEVGVSLSDLKEDANVVKKMNDTVNEYIKDSYLWGSKEWEEFRNHEKNRTARNIVDFVSGLIEALKLID